MVATVPPASSSRRTSIHSTDALSPYAWRDLGPRGRAISALRAVLLVVLVGLVAGLLAMEPTPWRIAIFAGSAVVVALMTAVEFAWLKHRRVTVKLLPYLVAPALVLHTATVAVTGGVESPFLVLYVVVGIVPSVIIGRVRPFLLYAALPLALLWFFSVGAATATLPDLTLRFLGAGHAHGNPWYAYTQAATFTAATLLGGSGILAIRAVVERTAHTAVAIRQELFDMMRERNRELRDLSGELAHELKNPLASIQGLSALVERKLPVESKEREQMGVLIGEVKRMGQILDEFLNFSRPVVSLSARSVLPAELLSEVVSLHEGLADQRGVTLALESTPTGAISCDPRKVKQVLVNLMHNALESTPAGGRITARVEPGPRGSARFVVTDSGTGIADEVRDSLFKPGVTTKADGSGLGLTIAQAITAQHGGKLELDEVPAGGCRAVLEIPPVPVGSAGEEEQLRTAATAAVVPELAARRGEQR